MHFQYSPQQLVLCLVIVALIFGRRRLRDLRVRDDELRRLGAELGNHMPVYSAETTQGKEAEFIRDRLPKKYPFWLVLAGVLAVGAALWWLNHR